MVGISVEKRNAVKPVSFEKHGEDGLLRHLALESDSRGDILHVVIPRLKIGHDVEPLLDELDR